MRLLSNLHVKGKPAVLPDRAIRRQSHYFIYRPRIHLNPSSPPLAPGEVAPVYFLVLGMPVTTCLGMFTRETLSWGGGF